MKKVLSFLIVAVFLALQIAGEKGEHDKPRGHYKHHKHVADKKVHEIKKLRELLGKPKENPVSAKAFTGTKKTTRLHKICSWKKHLKNKPDEWTEDHKVYDKLICGFYTMADEYEKHSRNAAAAILGTDNSEKSLEDQKKELFEAIHNMAKASGPLPKLNLKMIGRKRR